MAERPLFSLFLAGVHTLVEGRPYNFYEKELSALNRSYYNRGQAMMRQRMYNTMIHDACPCENVARNAEPAVDCDAMTVAMAYVPWQRWSTVYEPDTAFMQGTLFPDLDKPWLAGGMNYG